MKLLSVARRALRTSGIAALLVFGVSVHAPLHAPLHAQQREILAPSPSSRDDDGLLRLRLHSAALATNLLGDSADRSVLVWLPPDYETSTRRYRTVYLLHGYGARTPGYDSWLRSYGGFHLGRALDAMHAEGDLTDLIVVAVDGANSLGGSFYRDSPVSGNWDTYLTHEIVNLVDARLRTIPSASARGITGHSMGGYGAFVLATLHPDVFGAVYAMSPCCMRFDDRPVANASQYLLLTQASSREEVRTAGFFAALPLALAAIYSPNTERGPLFVNFPFRAAGSSVLPVSDVITRWHGQTPMRLADSLSANLAQLRAIGFDAGREDPYRDIPAVIPLLDSLLTARRIPHFAELYTGDHSNRIPERLLSRVLPFMDNALARTP